MASSAWTPGFFAPLIKAAAALHRHGRLVLIFPAALAVAGCTRPTAEADVNITATPTARLQPAGAAAAAKRAEFKFATQTLSVPAGFTVELVAGPPLVNRPISIAFDERGRLYATDSSGLSDKADKQFEQKPHRVIRLEDGDGDGRFEQSTVFAENMMFPQGALFYEGSLYVAAPPQLWKISDLDDDGVSDRREIWYDGKTLTGCANDLHGPYLGPDGWFYWTKGAFAEQRHTLPDGKLFVTRAAHIFRARPDGSGLEPVLTGGMANPVGVTFTAAGERILSGTFFQTGVAGKRDGLIHSIYGGVYGREQAALDGHVRTGDVMPIMTHMGPAAPCGSATYRSGGFGSGYADNVFVCSFNLRTVSRHELVPEGATYRTRDTDFVTSDSHDFHPTDVLEDADGSLLVVDTGGWYKICCPTSQLAKPDVLGGIYRIRKIAAPAVGDPRGLKLPWATMAPDALARLLDDGRPEVRERAVHLLGKKGEAAVSALAVIVGKSPSARARQHAVWALARIETQSARAAVRQALDDRDSSVVHVALQVTSLGRDAGAVARLAKFVAGDQPALTRIAAEALGRIGDERAIDVLLAAACRLGDTPVTALGAPEDPAERMLEHALIYALIDIGRSERLLAELEPGRHPRAVRAAMVALDQLENGGLEPRHVLGWLGSPVPRLKKTAAWVVGHHAAWGGELAAFYRERLAANPPDAAEAGELRGQLAQLAKDPAIQRLLAATATDPSAASETRLLAIRAMGEARLKETPGGWLKDLAALLASDDPAIIRQVVATVRVLPLPKRGHSELAAALAAVGRNQRLPAEVRLDALAATTPAALGAIEPPLLEFLCTHLDGKQPMLVRSAAANVLAKAPLTSAQQLALTETLRTIGPLEAPKLLPAFARAPNETLGLKLVAALKQSSGLAGLRANSLKPLFAHYPASVQQQGDDLLALLDAGAAGQNARVDELLAQATNGDIRRGQAVFNRDNTACSLCHKIGYRGGLLGPDLTNIGRIRSERELLEALVYPSATFVRGYEPFTARTKGGEEYSGIIKKETVEEVVLAIAPDAEQRVARADLVDLRPGAVSPMPPGADVVLTRQELADLVAFLKSRQ